MTVLRRALRLALVVALGTLTWCAGDSGADAAQLDAYSWWWRGNMGPAPLPPPPTVPEGGVLVGGAPDGATAIAAFAFTLALGESSPVLTLQVADEKGGDVAVMAACPAGSAWSPGERGGNWESKPTAACELGSVNGQRDAAAATWTFPVAPLVQGTELNIVITPGAVGGAPVNAPFQIAFEPPDAGSLVTSSTAGDSSATATAEDFPAPAVEGSFNPELPSGGLDIAPGTDLPTATPFAPALPESSQGVTATAPAVQRAQPPPFIPTQPASATREGAGLGFLVLLAAAAAVYYVNRAPTPPPRRLGPLASSAGHVRVATAVAADTGGLGRFARVRRGPPPRLL